MLFNYKIHNVNHIIKSLIGNISYIVAPPGVDSRSLLVLNLHGTPKKFSNQLEKHIQWLQRNFRFISPDEAMAFLRGNENEPENGPFMLLTFDDNLANNAHAIQVLDKYNIRALHFVITDFINAPKSSQIEFYKLNVRPEINAAIESDKEDLTSYSWEEMRIWYAKGHRFGVHTKSHTMVKDRLSSEELEKEIITSKHELAEGLGVDVNSIVSFCSINNTSQTVGQNELQLIKENYEFHFTTFAGINHSTTEKMCIRRLNIESFWLSGAVKFTLGKWHMNRWKTIIKKFEEQIA